MAQRRVYRASEMAALLQKQGISPHAFEAIMDSSTSDGSRSMMNFEGAFGNVMNQQYYRPIGAEETGDDNDFDACLYQPEKERRLTADKVQFLEKSFMLENKLEPERKMQLANDLGLQPRQVTIWFQNRRARWKTKQLEKDYEALKSGYNVLKMNCENLQKDNEKLKAEVIFLTDLLKEKGNNMTEPSQFKKLENDLVTEAKESERQVLEVKQEDLSSTNGAIVEFQSPHCTDRGQNLVLEPADSSNAFEHDHSDLSHAGEDEEVKGYHQFLKLVDNSDSFAFSVEEQAFWFWPY